MTTNPNVYEYGPDPTAEYDPEYIRSLELALNNSAPDAEFLMEDGDTIQLPKEVMEILRVIVHSLVRGQKITLITGDKELTTQEAADLLNVSRPFLVKLLDEGYMEYGKTGTHRRIRFSEVMRYRRQRDAQRRETLKHLADLDQEIGLDG